MTASTPTPPDNGPAATRDAARTARRLTDGRLRPAGPPGGDAGTGPGAGPGTDGAPPTTLPPAGLARPAPPGAPSGTGAAGVVAEGGAVGAPSATGPGAVASGGGGALSGTGPVVAGAHVRPVSSADAAMSAAERLGPGTTSVPGHGLAASEAGAVAGGVGAGQLDRSATGGGLAGPSADGSTSAVGAGASAGRTAQPDRSAPGRGLAAPEAGALTGGLASDRGPAAPQPGGPGSARPDPTASGHGPATPSAVGTGASAGRAAQPDRSSTAGGLATPQAGGSIAPGGPASPQASTLAGGARVGGSRPVQSDWSASGRGPAMPQPGAAAPSGDGAASADNRRPTGTGTRAGAPDRHATGPASQSGATTVSSGDGALPPGGYRLSGANGSAAHAASPEAGALAGGARAGVSGSAPPALSTGGGLTGPGTHAGAAVDGRGAHWDPQAGGTADGYRPSRVHGGAAQAASSEASARGGVSGSGQLASSADGGLTGTGAHSAGAAADGRGAYREPPVGGTAGGHRLSGAHGGAAQAASPEASARGVVSGSAPPALSADGRGAHWDPQAGGTADGYRPSRVHGGAAQAASSEASARAGAFGSGQSASSMDGGLTGTGTHAGAAADGRGAHPASGAGANGGAAQAASPEAKARAGVSGSVQSAPAGAGIHAGAARAVSPGANAPSGSARAASSADGRPTDTGTAQATSPGAHALSGHAHAGGPDSGQPVTSVDGRVTGTATDTQAAVSGSAQHAPVGTGIHAGAATGTRAVNADPSATGHGPASPQVGTPDEPRRASAAGGPATASPEASVRPGASGPTQPDPSGARTPSVTGHAPASPHPPSAGTRGNASGPAQPDPSGAPTPHDDSVDFGWIAGMRVKAVTLPVVANAEPTSRTTNTATSTPNTARRQKVIAGETTGSIPVHLLFRDDGGPATVPVAKAKGGKPKSKPNGNSGSNGNNGKGKPAPARSASRPAPTADPKLVERPGPVLPGWVGVVGGVIALIGCAAIVWWTGAVPAAAARMLRLPVRPYDGIHLGQWALLALGIVVALFFLGGLGRGRVGYALVLTLFGEYRGTVRRTGLLWVSPLLLRRRVDVRLRHWRSEPLPAVDAKGTALNVVVLVVWRIRDTVRAALGVEGHEEYLREQVEAAMARVLSQLPADAFHEDAPTLRDAEAVGEALTRMLSAECAPVGIDVFSAQPTRIEYAPEVAAAMQRRRIAAIDAKHRDSVLTAVVDAVDDVVHRLTSRGLVELDDYEKKALVKDLTVAFYTGRTAPGEGA